MAVYIAVEGIDGTGKSVQTSLLKQALTDRGLKVGELGFPDYESFFGKQIGRYLSAAEGVRADTVDQKSMALWFALDRWNTFRHFDDSGFDAVLINRYMLSNAVYQSIREIDLGKEDLLGFCDELEFGVLGIPRPDLQIILDVSPVSASENVDKKGFRGYVGEKKDVYEEQSSMQERGRRKYAEFAQRLPNAVLIPCMEEGRLLPIAIIHELVLRAVLPLFEK